MEWSSRITTVSLEMVLPGLAGYWIDGRLGTSPWLFVVGLAIGFGVGLRELVRITAVKQVKQHRQADVPVDQARDRKAGNDHGVDGR